MPDQLTIPSLCSWVDSIKMKEGQRKDLDAVILTTFRCLSNFHNSIVFGTTNPRKSILFDDIIDISFFWIFNRSSKVKLGWSPWLYNPVLVSIML